ncbi:MAG: hypothetical protein DDT21_02422 [Syntrophomonadaceae bacterium]|nr:hypothetical protein [Bacillota bacterium]
MRELQRDVVKVIIAALVIIAFVQMARNAGGVAQVMQAFFGGTTGILETVARA